MSKLVRLRDSSFVIGFAAMACTPVPPGAGNETATAAAESDESTGSSGPNTSLTGETGATTTNSTGSTSSSTSSATAGEATAGDDCITHYGDGELLRAETMLVLDRSRAMMQPWQSNASDASRWASVHAAAVDFVDRWWLDREIGVDLFPGSEATNDWGTSCLDEPGVEARSVFPSTFDEMLPAADANLAGSRPAADAVRDATAELLVTPPWQPKSIVYLASGPSACSFTDPKMAGDDLRLAIRDAADQGIFTYIVGLEAEPGAVDQDTGVEWFAQLNDLAVLGGTAKLDVAEGEARFHAANSHAELSAAFEQIGDATQSCSVSLGDFPRGRTVRLFAGGELIPQVETCDRADGWVLSPSFADVAILCGDVCSRVRFDEPIRVEFHCPLEGY